MSLVDLGRRDLETGGGVALFPLFRVLFCLADRGMLFFFVFLEVTKGSFFASLRGVLVLMDLVALVGFSGVVDVFVFAFLGGVQRDFVGSVAGAVL